MQRDEGRMKSAHSVLISLLRMLVCCAAISVGSTALGQVSFTTDASDLWWNAAESGWGMQIVAEGDASFATLFVYDAGGQPTFFTATLSLTTASTWSGDLYRTTGPYFGTASFNPALVSLRKVGTLTFMRTNSDAATLQYSVDGVSVSTSVTRQTLRNDNYSGTYTTIVAIVASHCSNSADNRAQTDSHVITIAQMGNTMTLSGSFAHRAACTYSGMYTQAGRVGAIGAPYTCADGDAGIMNFFELTRRPGMISGRLSGHSISDACDYAGAFTGLLPF